MANEFYFGEGTARLFGAYHPPVGAGGSGPNVILCPPFGEEAIRSFRIFRRLADAIAAAGGASLRFDYFGSGDSAGASEDLTFETMQADIRAAHDEIHAMRPGARTVWLGLRLGANAAIEAAATADEGRQGGPGPAGLILWEPVTHGAAHLEDIAARHVEATGFAGGASRAGEEALGFPLGAVMRDAIRRIGSECWGRRPARKALIVSDDAGSLPERLSAAGASVQVAAPPRDAPWNSDRALNSFSVPVRTIDFLATAIAEWR